MRKGFTLIELMIVIAIIAIIAAIAIPNLLESRITAQESGAATALKSGILPAEVQFQAGGYIDNDNNGVGIYAVYSASQTTPYDLLTGATAVGSNSIKLTLLAPAYKSTTPLISGYLFAQPITGTAPTATSDGTAESVWAVGTYPSADNMGRRQYYINQAGMIYQTKPLSNAFSGGYTAATGANVFGTSLVSAPNSSTYIPYTR